MKRLTKEELEAIRKRTEAAIGNHDLRAVYPAKAYKVLSEDIPKLLAEIDQLNEELAEFKNASTILLKQIDVAIGTVIPRGSFFHGREVLTEALLNADTEA